MAFNRDNVADDTANETAYRNTLHAIGIDLKEAQDMAMAMGLHDKYGVLQGNSFARFVQVYMRSSTIPMTEKNLSRLAEVRGRMNEILRFTLEIDSANLKVRELLKEQSRYENLLALISAKRKVKND